MDVVLRNLVWSSLGIVVALFILTVSFPSGLLLLAGLAVAYLANGIRVWVKKGTITSLLIGVCLALLTLYFWTYRPHVSSSLILGTLVGLVLAWLFTILLPSQR